MGIFSKKKEEIRMANTSNIVEFINNENYVNIDEKSSMQVAGIKKSVDLISGTIASLEIELFQEKNGKIIKIKKDNRLNLLNTQANSFETAYYFKRKMIKDMLLSGKGYALIDKKGININGLYYIENSQMTVTDLVNNSGMITDKRYNFVLNNISVEKDKFNMLEVGGSGEGILKENSEVIRTGIYLLNYDNYIFKNAILPSGVLETEGRLNEESAKILKSQLENMYSGIKNFFRPLILENGLKWKNISQKPNDLMLGEAKVSNLRDIERIFNLPYGTLINESNASLVNLSELIIEGLSDKITEFEECLCRDLLLENEKKNGYFFAVKKSDTHKLDVNKRAELFGTFLDKEIISKEQFAYEFDLEYIEPKSDIPIVDIEPKGIDNIEKVDKVEE